MSAKGMRNLYRDPGGCPSENILFSNALKCCFMHFQSSFTKNLSSCTKSDFYREFHHYTLQLGEVIFNYVFQFVLSNQSVTK